MVAKFFVDLEHREELMFAEFEEGIAFAVVEFFQIEKVPIERDGFLDVAHFDGDVIASVNLHTHLVRPSSLRHPSA